MTEENRLNRAKEILQEVFPDSTVAPSAEAGPLVGWPDFALKTSNSQIVVKVKATQSARLVDLEGRLASASLQVQRFAKEAGARPVIMIDLPKLGPKALVFALDYMAQNAPEIGWCLFDSSGAFRFEIPTLGISKSKKPRLEYKSRRSPARESLFSDLNRWMLKILLMRDVPSNLWGGPKERVMSAKDLRTVAKVSTEKAYSFLRAFAEAGYVRETSDGIIVTRRAEMLQKWLNHELAFRTDSVAVRWIFGHAPDLTKILLQQDGPTQFAVTGFEACHLLGVLHTPVPRKEVCIFGDVEIAIKAWHLQECEPRDADFLILKLPNPKSVLRGHVTANELPVVDVLEAALAVIGQLPRGAEQAQYIFTEVLHWEDCI
ncbi:MAG: hypothetical protein SGJ20_09530 [Planctomycetota bacterium]|nr:hypothetical protein [Planctomycetota bacterium]